MTARQQEIFDFIRERDVVPSHDIIVKFAHWFTGDVAGKLGTMLTLMVKQKMIEVIDGRYQVYDAMAHSVNTEQNADNQLNLF